MFRVSFKSYMYLLITVFVTVLFTHKIYESSEREANYSAKQFIKDRIQNDISSLIENELTRVFLSKSLPFKIHTNIQFESRDSDSYKVEKIEVIPNRKLASGEWGKLKTEAKIFLKTSGLASNPAAIKFIKHKIHTGQDLLGDKWLGTLKVISLAFMVFCALWLISGKFYRKPKPKKTEKNINDIALDIYACKAVPFGHGAKVQKGFSKKEVTSWKDLVTQLRKNEAKLNMENDLSKLECRV